MLTVSELCLAALFSLLWTTEATITGWTNPPITGKDGRGVATPSIAESLVPGSTGVTIAATDDGAASITYDITSQPDQTKLTIGATTGLLTLAAGKSFNFDTEPTYILTITATVSGSTGTASVTLSITSTNDAPVFAVTQYVVTIPDGSTAGTTLTTVSASDKNTENTITYSIIASGNTNSHFEIGASTGIIKIADSKSVNATALGGYQLVLNAVDNGSPVRTGTATVWVAVMTCSNKSVAIIASMITILAAFVASLQ